MDPSGKRAADVASPLLHCISKFLLDSKFIDFNLVKAWAIAVLTCHCNLRILHTRNTAEMADDKPTTNVQQQELSANGDIANSTENDAADMRKLGVQQETKVRSRLGKV